MTEANKETKKTKDVTIKVDSVLWWLIKEAASFNKLSLQAFHEWALRTALMVDNKRRRGSK